MRVPFLGMIMTVLWNGPLLAQAPPDRLLADAEALLQQHRYADARDAVERFWIEHGVSARGATRARALLLRSVLSESLEDAEVDLLRISVEHPQASEADGALMRLAQARLASGDSAAATEFLERLIRDHPASERRQIAREMLGLGPERPSGTRIPVISTPTEPGRRPESSDRRAEDSTITGDLTLELGWFGVVSDAEALRDAVRAAGFPAHLARLGRSGTTVVRVGTFHTRVDAETVARRLRQAGFPAEITTVVVP